MTEQQKVADCPRCAVQVTWKPYPEWGGIWVHVDTGRVFCEDSDALD